MAGSGVCERSEVRNAALSKNPSHYLERRQPTASLGSSGSFAQPYYPVLNVGCSDCMPTSRLRSYVGFRGKAL
jgi:hypothetical protein